MELFEELFDTSIVSYLLFPHPQYQPIKPMFPQLLIPLMNQQSEMSIIGFIISGVIDVHLMLTFPPITCLPFLVVQPEDVVLKMGQPANVAACSAGSSLTPEHCFQP